MGAEAADVTHEGSFIGVLEPDVFVERGFLDGRILAMGTLVLHGRSRRVLAQPMLLQ